MTRNQVFGNSRHIASVYRAWAADGTLLYVGHTTLSVRERMIAHAASATSEWYPLMVRLTSEEFPDLGPAKRAEDHAIATENPRYNRAGRPRADWVPRAAEIAPLAAPPEPDKVSAHGSLLRMLVARPAVRDVEEAARCGRPWLADHNGYRTDPPPRLYVSRGSLLDHIAHDLALDMGDVRGAVDRLALAQRRVRRVGPSARRMRWLEIESSEFSTDEWQMVIDVLPPRPVEELDEATAARVGRRADNTYEGESF